MSITHCQILTCNLSGVCNVLILQTFMEKHRNLAYMEQLLEDINRAERDRFEVIKSVNGISFIETLGKTVHFLILAQVGI